MSDIFEKEKLLEIPDYIYSALPANMRELCSHHREGYSKDVYLIGLLTTLSSCFHKMKTYWDGKPVYSNLFSCVLAPAASGKSIMTKSVCLTNDLDRYISERSLGNILSMQSKDNNDSIPQPAGLLISGNTTQSALLRSLHVNGGVGLIFEEELDTLGLTGKSEYKTNSYMYRDVFHHAAISSNTKTHGQVKISQPKVSLGVSGTPGQVRGLVKSIEDGLFSRFIFYQYSPVLEFTPMFSAPETIENMERLCDTLSGRILENHKVMEGIKSNRLIMSFDDDQAKVMKEHFTKMLVSLASGANKGLEQSLGASLKRLAVICIKICMVLYCMRNLGTIKPKLMHFCEEEDFDTALTLCEIFMNHAVDVAHSVEIRKYG